MPMTPAQDRAAIAHCGEDASNAVRQRIAATEPLCQRTYTPSLAVLARSAGCYHTTPEGRTLADFTSGVLVANLGHNPAGWWRRVLTSLGIDRLEAAGDYCDAVALTAYNAVTELEAQATERLLASLRSEPGGGRMERVLWSASGSEAVQKSLWAALARRDGADMIVATRGGFHGKKGLAGATSGSESDPERDPRVRFIGFPRDECRSVQRRRQPIDLAPYRRELDDLAGQYGARLGGLITEPYLGGGGSYHPQKEYLQLLEQFCRQHDILFILDEVQANFGRTGPMYAFTAYGVEPDIVVLGKGMANGVPVDAAVGRADVFATLNYGEGSDTWSAHPLGCAAVLATLDEFETRDVLGHAAKLSGVLEAGLLRLAELDGIAAVRGEGTVWGVECEDAGGLPAADVANRVVQACYLGDASGRAIHLLGPLAGKVIRVAPPLVMPLAEAETYLDAMHGIVAGLFVQAITQGSR
ncbi:MAG: 4-aminobutyrate--2-oxoglutarate transaminase [Planctomycetia bacterium]|nr:MAG: 4-aminobutyrate--2-oxoglutarate transaminase [Planctomycetia bacterium]